MKKIEIEDKYKMTLKEFVNAGWRYYYLDEGTLLHVAVHTNDFDLVKKAIDFGAEIDKPCSFGRTALFLAQDIKITKELINFGANPNYIDITELYKYNMNREIIEYLITESDIDLKDVADSLLLAMIEYSEDDYDWFKNILENAKNLNVLCDEETLLFDAARHMRDEKNFLLLVNSGINLYQRNKQGLYFYDYCKENTQNLLKEHIPEFIEKRARECQ